MLRKQCPPAAEKNGLWVGWSQDRSATIGFRQSPRFLERQPLIYNGDAHALTCAPTGSGKFVSVVGPTLATYPGSTITVDLKGEAYTVWSDWRRMLGHRVVLIDPCRELPNAKRDTLNPFDMFDLPGVRPEVECEMLASLLAEGHDFSTDPYWNDTSRGLMSGLIDHIRTLPPAERNPSTLRRMLHDDEFDYKIALALDNKEVADGSLARDEYVGYLTAPSDKTRPCILTTTQSHVKCLGSKDIAESLEKSTFPLQSLLDDEPLDLFLVFPARYLDSHRNVLRLLLHVILSTIGRRTRIPQRKTLLICDETAQLGRLPVLRQAITLLRGSGLICHTFWQDLSQIKQTYGNDFETILNNCGILQVFGMANYQMAESWSHILGMSPQELMSLSPDEQAVFIRGQGAFRSQKLNYLRDAEFAGRFAANPRYELHPYAEQDIS
ncbi:MAG: type IV secretory system conjugative DNA transfer family protein [Planctomycetaceae bacterium]|nr:type IV secretory system conjugative DNA transfer family protein [Planctomycetaceae bacterium]